MRAVRAAVALIEPVLVFLIATIASAKVLDLPFGDSLQTQVGEEATLLVLRWLPLVVLALLIDLAFRRRGLRAWGMWAPWRESTASLPMLAALLALGGAPALILTLATSQAAATFPPAGLAEAIAFGVGLVVPLIGQEVFIVGYAQRLFADEFGRGICALCAAVLFMLAHMQHASAGALGYAFIAAMALQGALWSLARSKGAPLPFLMLAHFLLLIGYLAPLGALAGSGVLSLLTIRAWPATLRAIFEPTGMTGDAHECRGRLH